jgi:predicted acylesterase/phospholipase RssA
MLTSPSFTCITSREGKHISLASYPTRSCPHDLLNSATIWEATRASLASTFAIEPVAIASTSQTYNDSTLVANNPIRRLWAEANTTYPAAPLKLQLGCLVSIGTGAPSVLKFNTSVPGLVRTLQKISNETEATANTFIRENTELDDEGRYFRFSVPNGLADIRPDEVGEMNTIVDATQEYVMQELVFKYVRRCARAVGASGKRASVPVVSAWEVPGARRSLDNGECGQSTFLCMF